MHTDYKILLSRWCIQLRIKLNRQPHPFSEGRGSWKSSDSKPNSPVHFLGLEFRSWHFDCRTALELRITLLNWILFSLLRRYELHCHKINRKTSAVTDPKQLLATEITRTGISELENVLFGWQEQIYPKALNFLISVSAEACPHWETEILESAFLLVRDQVFPFFFQKQPQGPAQHIEM